MDIFEKISVEQKTGKPIVLATVVRSVGSAPRSEGAKMLIHQDGTIDGTIGGGAVEKAVMDLAAKIMGTPETKLVEYDLGKDLAMSCGGKMTVFLEPLTPQPQLIIFGAGHIGTALLKIGKMLSFKITVVDNRPEFANHDRLAEADTLIAMDYNQAVKKVSFTPESYIVLVTHRHAHDQELLEYCIQQPFKYIGMIGSKTKVKKTFDILREKETSEDTIRKIHSPIGLDIGADTPAELAIAIAGEIIGIQRGN
jgi:xanthine dehydrogenase accessory factor